MNYGITTKPRNDARTATAIAAMTFAASAVLLVLFGGSLAHADATTTPIISSISASSTDTMANIQWVTDIPATSQIAYGTSTSYDTFSAFDTNLLTNHIMILSALSPDTLYHYQIMATSASGTMATSTDQTFTTAPSSTGGEMTPTSTPPVISSVNASPTDVTAQVNWTTDQPATSRAMYGTTTSYGASSALDLGLVMNHSIVLTSLIPSTLYHYQVMSGNASGTVATSSDQVFTTNMTATTSTSTTDRTLQDIIHQILEEIRAIRAQIAALIAAQQGGGSGGGGTGTTTPSMVGPARIDQNGASARAGTSIDFGGHNFGSEEHVLVTLNGFAVGTAFTNQGGGFSTGSMSIPSVPGTYTYTFTGQRSGLTATAVVMITL